MKVVLAAFLTLFLLSPLAVFSALWFGGGDESPHGPLDGAQKETAQRICYAFRSKRVAYALNYFNKNFTFEIEKKDCHSRPLKSQVLSAKLQEKSSHGLMAYRFPNGQERPIFTDKNGKLAGLCSELMRGKNPTGLLASEKGKVEFVKFGSEGGDHFTYVLKEKGRSQKTTYYVETLKEEAPFHGHIYRIVQEGPDCSSSFQELRTIVDPAREVSATDF